MKNNPCKDCSRRQKGCHSNCNEYIIWRADKDLINSQIRANREKLQLMPKRKRAR